jgi:hypothetical protein
MIECNHLFLNISVALQTVFVAHVRLTEGQLLCEGAAVNRNIPKNSNAIRVKQERKNLKPLQTRDRCYLLLNEELKIM